MNSLEIVLVIVLVAILILIVAFFAYWILKRNKQNVQPSLQPEVNKSDDLDKWKEQKDAENKVIMEALRDQLNQINNNLFNIKSQSDKIIDVRNDVQKLNNIFSNQKQRGLAGEFSLQLLLEEQFGNSNCLKKEYKLPSGGRIDFYIETNEGKGIGIDAKFPFENYRNENSELAFEPKELKSSIKKMITDLNKKYVQTKDLDSVVMYIPSEGMFSLLCQYEFEDVFRTALNNNVYICSPTTLNMQIFFLFKSIKEFNLKKNIDKIIEILVNVQNDFEKWNERYEKLNEIIDKLVDTKNDLSISTNKIKNKLNKIESNINNKDN